MLRQLGGLALVLGLGLFARAGEAKDDLLTAARKGNLEAVKALLAKGADVNTKTAYGQTALMLASDKGHTEVVKLLIKHKADVNVKDTFYGLTPLAWAAYNGHAEITKALLEAGAKDAETALSMAIGRGHVETVRAALDLGKFTPAKLSQLLPNVPEDSLKIRELLLKAGAKPAATTATPSPKEDLTPYVGVYRSPEGTDVKITLQNGKLQADFGTVTGLALRPLAKDTFQLVAGAALNVTFRRDSGKVNEFTVKQEKSEQVYKRVQASANEPVVQRIEEKPVKVTSPRNWPSFRGPNASGNGDGQQPPTYWDAEKGFNVQWKTPIPGLGHSCPVVWGNRVFVTTAVSGNAKSLFKPGQYGDVESVNDTSAHTWHVYCLDKRDGKVLWQRQSHAGVPKVKRHTKGSHANPTPATDGTHVVACFGSEGLYCYDFDGKLCWQKDLGVLDSGWFFDADYQWGFASSPILYKHLVIVQCDIGKNSFIAAYDVRDGRQVWLTPREEVPSWGTPTIYQGPPRDELVTNATKFIRGYDPLTGKELWRLSRNSEITVGTPVTGQGLIFVTGGYRPIRPVYAIRPGASGDISLPKGKSSSSSIVWSNEKEGTYMPTPIVYGEYLYTCNNNGMVTCYEAKTGKQVYQRRIGGRGGYTSSPVAADGRLYLTSEEGGVLVVRAGPKYELLATNPMGDVCMATPAISDGMIYVRTQHFLYGIGRPAVPAR
jgi:outer membrane protein assembly factor BamB